MPPSDILWEKPLTCNWLCSPLLLIRHFRFNFIHFLCGFSQQRVLWGRPSAFTVATLLPPGISILQSISCIGFWQGSFHASFLSTLGYRTTSSHSFLGKVTEPSYWDPKLAQIVGRQWHSKILSQGRCSGLLPGDGLITVTAFDFIFLPVVLVTFRRTTTVVATAFPFLGCG